MKEIDILVNTLKLKGYSYKTIKSYKSNVSKFLESETETVDSYILRLIDSKKYKESTINQIINSLNFYHKYVIKDSNIMSIKFLKDNKSLPEVLSKSEVKRVIDSIKNLKHRVIFTIIYSSGLRVGEVVSLKIQNIDFDRRLVHIKNGKGKKDRYTLLSNSSIALLEKYLPTVVDSPYMFPGQKENSHLSIRSVQQIMSRQIKLCNINKNVSVHSLRHSFATHLLEQGIDIRYIQELLGHYNIKTTEIYTHVALPKINEIKNPLDF